MTDQQLLDELAEAVYKYEYDSSDKVDFKDALPPFKYASYTQAKVYMKIFKKWLDERDNSITIR